MAAYAGMIRDTELEAGLQKLIAPLVEAAGYPPNSIAVRIIIDPNYNAFVAGEQMVSLLGCGAMIFGIVLALFSEYKKQQVPVISSRPVKQVVYVQAPVQQQPPIQFQQSIGQTQQPTYGSSVPRPERFPKQPK